MKIHVDENEIVVAYSSFGAEDGIEVDEAKLPEGFEDNFWPGRWKYSKKKLSETGTPNPAAAEEERIKQESAAFEQRQSAAEIAFVAMAQAGQLDDVTITEHNTLFTAWAVSVAYAAGTIVQDNGVMYKCVQAHTSQGDWRPSAVPALWQRIGDPAEEWPEWMQPIGAHDAYALGDKVTCDKKHWVSNIDGNVWKPGVYGWIEQ